MSDGTCTVEGCERTPYCRGWCVAHYLRWKRNGDTGPVEVRRYVPQREPTCIVEGCENPPRVRGWCAGHYQRWMLTGDPGPAAFKYQGSGDNIGYFAAHDRVRVARGSAREHVCAHCGGPARDWAYDHSDPDERTAPEDDPHAAGMPYSLDIARYLPLCKACHNRFDKTD